MADPQQIEQELREFLDKEDNIRKSDRLPYLMAIVNKHFAIDKIDHVVVHHDLNEMMSRAKSEFKEIRLPMVISNKDLVNSEASLVLLLEAFIGYLNKNKLLKRLVKFDYRR